MGCRGVHDSVNHQSIASGWLGERCKSVSLVNCGLYCAEGSIINIARDTTGPPPFQHALYFRHFSTHVRIQHIAHLT